MSDLLFILSKILWLLIKPSHILLIMLIAGILRLILSGGRKGRRLITLATIALLVLGFVPAGDWLARGLEDRFRRPQVLPVDITGVIVLGGGQSTDIAASRNVLALNDAAERMVEGLAMALRYPDAKLVFSGHSAALLETDASEVQVNAAFIELMQFDPARVIYEDRSRNTFENALNSQELLDPQVDDVWILITSAMHMPRAMGIFGKLGWRVIPYPTDYQTTVDMRFITEFDLSARLVLLDAVTREYVGLLAYYLLDRTDTLLPVGD